MFKFLHDILGKRNLLQEALEQSWTMLQIDKQMFDASVKSLRGQDTSEVELDIYETDRRINQLERDVRRKVLTHLTVSGQADLSIGLTLVSVIHDIERIGDYTKNIYELAVIHPKRLLAGKWENNLQSMEHTVSEHLGNLIQALKSSDSEMAQQILRELAQVKDGCDDYIMLLIKGEGESFRTSEAVPLALYMRYLKRVSAHIQNVASSIVNPFHRLKYLDEQTEPKGRTEPDFSEPEEPEPRE